MLEELLLTGLSDPDANAWADAVQGAGGFVTGSQRRRVAALIRSLKAAGVWPLLDRLWLFAAENNVQALIDLKAIATATLVNSPTGLHDSGRCGVRRKKVFFHQHIWSRNRYWRHSRRTADNVRSVTRTMNEAGAA
ncbi:MAG: hypothetical protein WCP68_23385 [Enhydrobacter sp.]